jgi:hypothetical protein
MRRVVITILAVALSVAAAATVAQATTTFGLRTPITVTPARGTPTTTFTVGFKTPFAIGTSLGLRSWEVASVTDRGQTSGGCAYAATKRLPGAAARRHVSATLSAGAKSWCTGSYAGTVTLYRQETCNPSPASRRMACPEIAFAPETIGRFRFTVARS